VRRLPGRNRTKADIRIHSLPSGEVAVKDYGGRSWWVRQTLGRFLIRRETRAYGAAEGISGLAPFLGRLGPYSLATRWVEGRSLSDHPDGTVDGARFDALDEIVSSLHRRGVALADLNHRDVLLAQDGSVHVIDLAMAWVLGERPGRLRRRIFEQLRASDLFSLARLRARFTGEDPANAIANADPAALAWHRRARRLKYLFDRLRGAERLPPVDDHWRF